MYPGPTADLVRDQRAARRPPRRTRAPILLAVAFGLTSIGLLAFPRTTLAWSANSFSSDSERQLVALTNQARASAGLRALRVDSTLTSIARWRSKDMIVRDYFSHNIPPAGYTVFHVLDQKHYCYNIAGENIGWNNYPDDVATTTVQRQFMNSPGHRANILGKSWDVIGVGAYKGADGKKMWTVLFADRCGSSGSSGSSGSTSPKPKPTPRPNPTPRPTVKPKPAATPAPTPPPTPTPLVPASPAAGPDEVGLGFGPGGRHDGTVDGGGNGNGSSNGNGGASGGGPPPGTVRDATPGTAEGSLRVVDPSTPPGLFEAVVADVTGFFLGN